MTVSKITNTPTPLQQTDKINEIIDNLGMGGGGLAYIEDCPVLTPVNNVCIWTVTHTLETKDVIIRVVEKASGETVMADANSTATDTVVVKIVSSTNIAAGEYTVVIAANQVSGEVEPGGRNIGEIVKSSIPLNDAGLHLLDGSVLNGSGIYKEFVDHMAGLYGDGTNIPNYFCDGIIRFEQPVLSSNGTMGGDSFAVSCSSNGSSRDAYKSFDGNMNTKWGVNNTTEGWLKFYNPSALKVSSITYTPVSDYPSEDGGTITIYGSNNDSTWVKLYEGTYDGSSSHVFTLTTQSFYKYYRINITNGISNWPGLGELTIDAVYQIDPDQQWQNTVAQYGTCGKYVYKNELNTRSIRLPKLVGIVEGTDDVDVLGDITEAGVPNITGQVGTSDNASYYPSGAFYQSASSGHGNGSGGSITVSMDASRSSSVYGKSDTIQPQTVKVFYYVVVANVTKSAIVVDIDNIANDLDRKADKDLSNITNTAKETIVGWGMPDYSARVSRSSNVEYTAESDGYIFAQVYHNAETGTSSIQVTINSSNIGFAPGATDYGRSQIYLPIKKGDVYKVVANDGIVFYPIRG